MKKGTHNFITLIKQPPYPRFIGLILCFISIIMTVVTWKNFDLLPFATIFFTLYTLFSLSLVSSIFFTSTLLSEKKIMSINRLTGYRKEVFLRDVSSFAISRNTKMSLTYLRVVNHENKKYWFYYNEEMFDDCFLSEMHLRNIKRRKGPWYEENIQEVVQ